MKKLLRYIYCLLLLSLVACHAGGEMVDDDISLTLKLATGVTTRGNVTDSPSNADSWTQAERAVDGRYIYSLSVYIIDAEKNIVASQENIAVSNQATEVVVKFDKSEKLQRGVHTLMAVANNVDHTIGNTTLNSGITQWAASSYNDLMNSKIAVGSDFVSPKDVVQPLSLMKEFEIHAGSNFVEGELTRTFARVRIEVKNDSGSLPLKINGVTFSNNFAQQSAYVFDDGSDRKYFTPTGAITSTSNNALQPFVRDNNANYKTIPSQSSAVVYDGYQLESKADGEFTYTLDMTYDGTVASYDIFSASNAAISNVSTLNSNISDESYFLIYNTTTGKYLSANGNSVTTSALSNFENIGTDNVWQITNSGNSYYIRNVETKGYMQAVSNNSAVTLGVNSVAFKLDDYNYYYNYNYNSVITLKSNNYVGVINSGTVRGYSSRSDNPVGFYFYKVTKKTETKTENINYKKPITLTSIDPVTQQSSRVAAIKRNDFINVLVTVSYNPVSGEFDFRVEDWQTGGGEVEFN